jgi:hypothetical protein
MVGKGIYRTLLINPHLPFNISLFNSMNQLCAQSMLHAHKPYLLTRAQSATSLEECASLADHLKFIIGDHGSIDICV